MISDQSLLLSTIVLNDYWVHTYYISMYIGLTGGPSFLDDA